MATSVQEENCWSRKFCSKNISVDYTGIKAVKSSVEDSFDVILSSVTYVEGNHFFYFKWNSEVTTHVILGAAETDLKCSDVKPLLGHVPHSIAWDVFSRSLYMNGQLLKQYPQVDLIPTADMEVVMNMNIDTGSLKFFQVHGNRCIVLGTATDKLKEVNKVLHAAASVASQEGELAMKYVGTFDAEVEESPLGRNSLSFSRVTGVNVHLKEHATIATRKSQGHGTVFTHRPLRDLEMFEVQIDKLDQERSRSLHIGVTPLAPMDFQFPSAMFACNAGSIWTYSGNKMYFQAEAVAEVNADLDRAAEKIRVGLRLNGDNVEFFFDGYRQASISLMDTKAAFYGFVELHGITREVALVHEFMTPLTSDQMIACIQPTLAVVSHELEEVKFVNLVIDKRLQEPFSRMDERMKELIADKLATDGAPGILFKFLQLVDARRQTLNGWADTAKTCVLSVFIHYSDFSPDFALGLCLQGLVQYVIEELQRNQQKTEQTASILSYLCFGILHNCSKVTDAKPYIAQSAYLDVLKTYQDVKRFEDMIQLPLVAYITTARVFEDQAVGHITMPTRLVDELKDKLKSSITAERQGKSSDYTSMELCNAILHLCFDEVNRNSFYKAGFIDDLLKVLDYGSFKQRKGAIEAIQAMLMQSSVKELKNSPLHRRLEGVSRDDKHRLVREVAKELTSALDNGRVPPIRAPEIRVTKPAFAGASTPPAAKPAQAVRVLATPAGATIVTESPAGPGRVPATQAVAPKHEDIPSVEPQSVRVSAEQIDQRKQEREELQAESRLIQDTAKDDRVLGNIQPPDGAVQQEDDSSSGLSSDDDEYPGQSVPHIDDLLRLSSDDETPGRTNHPQMFVNDLLTFDDDDVAASTWSSAPGTISTGSGYHNVMDDFLTLDLEEHSAAVTTPTLPPPVVTTQPKKLTLDDMLNLSLDSLTKSKKN